MEAFRERKLGLRGPRPATCCAQMVQKNHAGCADDCADQPLVPPGAKRLLVSPCGLFMLAAVQRRMSGHRVSARAQQSTEGRARVLCKVVSHAGWCGGVLPHCWRRCALQCSAQPVLAGGRPASSAVEGGAAAWTMLEATCCEHSNPVMRR